jgi:hypothetical protein
MRIKNLVMRANTFLLDKVLPYYFNDSFDDGPYEFVETRGKVPVWGIKILLLPPVRAAIEALRRPLSGNRFYYAPDPDEEMAQAVAWRGAKG